MATYLITGASRGIGRELALQLKARGETVIGTSRKPSPALVKAGIEVIDGIEVTDPAAVERIRSKLGARRIDILVNNAGISHSGNWRTETTDSMRELFEVNAIAPIVITRGLLPSMAKGGKIVLISSRLGSIADTTAAIPDVGYRMSKAALNIAGKLMADSLKSEGLSVVLIHPGYVKTEMNGGAGDITADVSAKGLIALIDRNGLAETGTYWHVNGNPIPW